MRMVHCFYFSKQYILAPLGLSSVVQNRSTMGVICLRIPPSPMLVLYLLLECMHTAVKYISCMQL